LLQSQNLTLFIYLLINKTSYEPGVGEVSGSKVTG
jgi:hypothetical protein